MSHWPEHLAGITTHARRGEIAHVFRHRVDYVLIDPESRSGPMLFSRNGPNLASVHDRTHGGPRGQGRGAAWARETLQQAGAPGDLTLRLLAQPRFFGFWFDPVSFWLGFAADGTLRAVIAEVSNTFNPAPQLPVRASGLRADHARGPDLNAQALSRLAVSGHRRQLQLHVRHHARPDRHQDPAQ